jgi:predicted RNA-binding Zn-ribbon protein involved in translation (DUF1610 family)
MPAINSMDRCDCCKREYRPHGMERPHECKPCGIWENIVCREMSGEYENLYVSKAAATNIHGVTNTGGMRHE